MTMKYDFIEVVGLEKAPFYQKDAQPLAVYQCDRSNLTFASGSDDGDPILNWNPVVGNTTCIPSNQTYFRNFAGRGLGYSASGPTPPPDQFISYSFGANLTGPFTFVITAQSAVGGAPVANARLFSIGNNLSPISHIEIVYGAAHTTALTFERGDDVGNVDLIPLGDPGSDPFVVYAAYDGTSLYWSLNGAPISSALAVSGAVSLDAARWGIYATNNVLKSLASLRAWYVDNTYRDPVQATSLIRYYCRQIGL